MPIGFCVFPARTALEGTGQRVVIEIEANPQSRALTSTRFVLYKRDSGCPPGGDEFFWGGFVR
jgi:hypothetical protein